MVTFPRHYPRLTALASAAVVATALIGIAGRSGGEAPASLRVVPATARLSPSGKIVDRLPNNAPATVHFADRLAPPPPAELVALDRQAGPASPITGAFATAQAMATEKPPLIAEAKASETAAPKPFRAAARPHRPPVTVAALPPPRPASLRALPDVAEIAGVRDKRISVAARMIAFVGSLARPL